MRGPMQTECSAGQLEFEAFDGRRVVAAFDGGAVTSDAGAVLLREADRAIGLIRRVAACFTDHRDADQVIHALPTLIGQRIIAVALGMRTSTTTTPFAVIRCWRCFPTSWSRSVRIARRWRGRAR